jgi:sigma-E factor negative regulatory protein RseB
VSHLHHKVSALIDGELQGAARRRALAHARKCTECQRELEQTYALKQRLLGLAAAEPPADLFAALGSVRTTPVSDETGPSLLSVATRRALVGAGSVSLAVLILAYAVGGSDPTTATVTPPVKEFQAEFAGSTGLAPLADPAVEALAAGTSSHRSTPVGRALTQQVAAMTESSGRDDRRAVRWLRRAAAAPLRVAYTGVRHVMWFGASGESSISLVVRHTPRQGTSYSATKDPGSPNATFIAKSEADGSGLDDQPVSLLMKAYDVSVVGSQLLDGRRVTVVSADRDGVAAARFWIDDETGLLLKREMYDDGQLARVSSLTDLKTSHAGFMKHLPPELEAPPATRVSTHYAPTLNDDGWACPSALPDDFTLTFLHRLRGDRDVMHAAYSDGLSTVSVFEERGALDPDTLSAFEHVTSDGGSLWVREGLPTVVVWQSDDTVYTLLTDAPTSTTAELVAALPHHVADDSGSRLGRGLSRIGSFLDLGR